MRGSPQSCASTLRFIVDLARFQRVGHLRPYELPLKFGKQAYCVVELKGWLTGIK